MSDSTAARNRSAQPVMHVRRQPPERHRIQPPVLGRRLVDAPEAGEGECPTNPAEGGERPRRIHWHRQCVCQIRRVSGEATQAAEEPCVLRGGDGLAAAYERGLGGLGQVKRVGELPAGRREDGTHPEQVRPHERFAQLLGATGEIGDLVGDAVQPALHEPDLNAPHVGPKCVPDVS